MVHHHNFTITTDKNFYLPGEEINGTVTFIPRKTCSMNFIKIYFQGEEYCIQKVSSRTGTTQPLSKQIFTRVQSLVSDKTRYEMQTYSWNFRFVIPRNIPPSCNFKRQTRVWYKLRAKGSTGFGHFDVDAKLPIIVGHVWVPPEPQMKSKTLNTMAGDIYMDAICNMTVAKCGEEIRCIVNFKNDSTKNIVGMRIKLKQLWECSGIVYQKSVVCKRSTKEGFPIAQGTSRKTISMDIPDSIMDCPTVKNATLFKCRYMLNVYGVTKMAGLVDKGTIKVKLPIIISRGANTNTVEGDDSNPTSPVHSPTLRSQRANNENAMNEIIRRLSISNSETSSSSLDSESSSRSLSRANSGNFIDDFNFIFNNPVLTRNGTNAQGEEQDEIHNHNDDKDDDDDCCLPKEDKEGDQKENELKKSNNGTGECVICFDGAKNMLLLPCAHISTCYTCTSQIMKNGQTCPVCRARITQIVRTYRV